MVLGMQLVVQRAIAHDAVRQGDHNRLQDALPRASAFAAISAWLPVSSTVRACAVGPVARPRNVAGAPPTRPVPPKRVVFPPLFYQRKNAPAGAQGTLPGLAARAPPRVTDLRTVGLGGARG